ncbi:hypothetical protein HELRODRAFT_193817 [Helobdella robusta]|uniref:C2 domain-containing protein n=1 Tax=Helobdella robusta TaxID=6412 RepID=T1FVE1_HELRO|nr:hypothetical protein HELRODRAFT_193817 [Helobdella robusta]ESN94048.1 hypothetical protein HELRODRAFT_193817 [Helobdella robusta]
MCVWSPVDTLELYTYVHVVGNLIQRTKTIHATLDPVWDQYFQFVVDQTRGQWIDVQVFDEDAGSTNDDPLGNVTLDIEMVASKKNVDIWLPLSNAPTGAIHMRALWLAAIISITYLFVFNYFEIYDMLVCNKILYPCEQSEVTGTKSLNTGKPRNTYVKAKLLHDSRRTTIKYGTGDPVWGENFNFFITNPQKDQLELELVHKGSSKETTLATMMVPINSVMLTKNLSLIQEYPLLDIDRNCSITIRFILRVLKCKVCPVEWSQLSGAAALSFGNVLKQQFDGMNVSGSNNDNVFSFGLGGLSAEDPLASVGEGDDEAGDIPPKIVTVDKTEEEEEEKQDNETNVDPSDVDPAAKPAAPQEPAPPKEVPPPTLPPTDIKKKVAETVPHDESNYQGDYKLPQAMHPTPPPEMHQYESPQHPKQPILLQVQPHFTSPQQPQQLAQPRQQPFNDRTTPSPSLVPKFGASTTDSSAAAAADVVASKKPPSKFGQIQLTIRHSGNRNKLVLVVHQCKNLIPCDKDNLADPYVRMYLLPDRTADTKRKTKLVKNTLNPTFDETFEWDLGVMEFPFRTLEVAVKNDVGVFSKSRTDMGVVAVELAKLGNLSSALTQWFDLEDPKGH